MNEWETKCAYNVAETCVESVTVEELLKMAGVTPEQMTRDLLGKKLTYGWIEGSEKVRSLIAGLYQKQTLANIVTTHGCIGANMLVHETLVEPGDHVISVIPTYQQHYSIPESFGARIETLRLKPENGFLPDLDELRAMVKPDTKLICINNPNNPTGAAYSKEQLKAWVDYAKKHDAVILYDAAYEYFIQDETLARSIYQVEGAKECAIEICSYSKTAGFTGVRCGYTIVPCALTRGGHSLNRMWARRQSTKFNGVSYITQMGAAAVFSEEGEKQIKANLDYYRNNAKIIADCMDRLGIWYTGGKHSPYIWLRCPNGMDSWAFFDLLLEKANVVGTPGSGFGKNGEGYFRLTAFGTEENTREACRRLEALLSSLQ